VTILLVLLGFIVSALVPAGLEARTAEVHLVVKTDLQRLHPNAPPDEPLEPAPAIGQKAREAVAAHPAFREVTARVTAGETAPNPRVPADYVRLVDRGVDDVVVVNLVYHLRLDSFRAVGQAAVQGYVAVHSVAGRRKVSSRAFTVVVAYPGDVTKEAVIQSELGARAKGSTVPIEEVELGLLDAAVKQRLDGALRAALGIYYPASLPRLSRENVEEGLVKMASFLSSAPDRKNDAILVLETYVKRYPDSPQRADFEQRLRKLRPAAVRGPGPDAKAQPEWQAIGISRALTAKELAETFERLVGAKLELWSFKLDWRDGTLLMTPTDRNQDFIVDDAPPGMKELAADPNPIFILVVGRRADPRIPGVDVQIPVVRFLGCPKTACPGS
jgi:hypothetical protein